jgi:hypothetical protein
LFPPLISPFFDLLGLVGVDGGGLLDLLIFGFGRGGRSCSLLLLRFLL